MGFCLCVMKTFRVKRFTYYLAQEASLVRKSGEDKVAIFRRPFDLYLVSIRIAGRRECRFGYREMRITSKSRSEGVLAFSQ